MMEIVRTLDKPDGFYGYACAVSFGEAGLASRGLALGVDYKVNGYPFRIARHFAGQLKVELLTDKHVNFVLGAIA